MLIASTVPLSQACRIVPVAAGERADVDDPYRLPRESVHDRPLAPLIGTQWPTLSNLLD